MVCTTCGKGELVLTQVPRFAMEVDEKGTRLYGVAAGVFLAGIVGIGLGLGTLGRGWFDPMWIVVAIPVVLILCTPLVVYGAFRLFSEREVLRCTLCEDLFESGGTEAGPPARC